MQRLWIVGRVAVMVGVFASMIGCAAQSPETDEPSRATPIVEATEPPVIVTDAPSPTHPPETITPTATPTAPLSLAVTPSGTRIDPALKLQEPLGYGHSENLLGWSPSGAWVWYEGVKATYFYHPQSGDQCSINRTSSDGTIWSYNWSWLAGDRLLVRALDAGGLVVINDPCVEISNGARVVGFDAPFVRLESASPDYQRVLLSTPEQVFIYYAESGGLLPIQLDVNADNLLDAIWSPQGSRVALIKTEPQGETDIHTWIIDPATGGLIDELQWGYFGGDPPRWPTWITENRLVFYMSKQGPLMLTIGHGVINVASELFGYDCSTTVCQIMTVEGARSPDGFYSLLLRDVNDSNNRITMLYHGKTGETELLSDTLYGLFSPDGRWLLQWQPSSDNIVRAGIRPVDPPASSIQPLDIATALVMWHPNSRMVAVHTRPSIQVYALDGTLLGEWWSDHELLAAMGLMAWSPDGRQLLVTGASGGVYVIPMPDDMILMP